MSFNYLYTLYDVMGFHDIIWPSEMHQKINFTLYTNKGTINKAFNI